MSGKAIVFLLLVVAAIGGWRAYGEYAAQAEAETVTLPDGKGTVVVYGRDSCSYTQRTLAFLKDNNVPTTYVDIDAPGINPLFQERFADASFITDKGYPLPVVEINGHASARPDPSGLLTDFRISQRMAGHAN